MSFVGPSGSFRLYWSLPHGCRCSVPAAGLYHLPFLMSESCRHRRQWCPLFGLESLQSINARCERFVIRNIDNINPLVCKGNYSATSNNMKLVHWPLMGGCYIWYSEWVGPRGVGRNWWRGCFYFHFPPPLPFHPPSLSLSFPLPPLPLEVGPP